MSRTKPKPVADSPFPRPAPRPARDVIAEREERAWAVQPAPASMLRDLATLRRLTIIELGMSSSHHHGRSYPTNLEDPSTWPDEIMRHAWWVASRAGLFGRRQYERGEALGLIAPAAVRSIAGMEAAATSSTEAHDGQGSG